MNNLVDSVNSLALTVNAIWIGMVWISIGIFIALLVLSVVRSRLNAQRHAEAVRSDRALGRMLDVSYSRRAGWK